ncbi:hypothetical protein T492DRAFT_1003187 [Pavlovales sp. CCMP2436]|nr:hypothetical protein T492DRAFT_1003187 [Pavlovales sp. CCMP2436]
MSARTIRARSVCIAAMICAAALPCAAVRDVHGRRDLGRCSAPALAALRGGFRLGKRREEPPPPPKPAGFLQRAVVEPLKAAMQHGSSPHTLTASIALGGACGVFPVPLTTWAVTLLANALLPMLNPLAMQLANSLVTPLMVPLFPVFLATAARLKGPMAAEFRFADIKSQFAAEGFVGALKRLQEPLGRAVVGWAVLLPVIFGVLYVLTLKPSHMLSAKYGQPAAAL